MKIFFRIKSCINNLTFRAPDRSHGHSHPTVETTQLFYVDCYYYTRVLLDVIWEIVTVQVSVEAKEFAGLSRVKQHQLVTDSLKSEIAEMHGIRIHTTATPAADK